MKTKVLLILLLTGFIYENVNGQLVTDRPDQTESSSTVPGGALQLESGILLGFESSSQTSNRQILLPTNLFRYGITKGIELRLLNQFELLKVGEQHSQGISDIEVGTKIQLLKKENVNTEIAFLTHLTVPTGTIELSGDKFGTSNKLSVSHGINEYIGIGYNLGYNYFGDGNGDITYSLALGIGINEKVAVYIEPYGEYANMEDAILNFDTGFTYLIKNNIQLDFSFGAGMNHKMNYLSAGFSWLLEKE